MAWYRRGLGAGCLVVALYSGCGSPEPRVVTVAPRLAPPPPGETRLTREEVLRISRSADDAGDAIDALDRHPFDFELEQKELAWFGKQGLDPTVVNYLEKRSRVDWEALRGDFDPDAPPPE